MHDPEPEPRAATAIRRIARTDFARATLTIPEVAQVLGISRTTAYESARSGTIAGCPVIRIGRRLVVSRSSLERALDAEAASPNA